LKPEHEEFYKKHISAKHILATEDLVYVLYNDKSIQILKASHVGTTLVEKMGLKLEGNAEVSSMALHGKELWVSDNKGNVHILDADTLMPKEIETPLKTVYGHPAISMAASTEASLVAVGDAKGYVTFFSTESRQQTTYSAYHKNKVIDMQFTQAGDHLFSVGQEKISFLVNTKEPKNKIQLDSK